MLSQKLASSMPVAAAPPAAAPKDTAARSFPAELIARSAGPFALEYVIRRLDIESAATSIHLTNDIAAISTLPQTQYAAIANLARLNDIRRLNKFLEAVNEKLAEGGRLVGCVQTAEIREREIRKAYVPVVAQAYLCGEWLLKRACPKLPVLKQFYFLVTNGRDRALTLTEALGRLYCCGFRIEHMEEHGGLLFFSAVKERRPAFDAAPSYGVLFRMHRIGKGGRDIIVWKIRTMHAYAEYLQQYVYERNNLDGGGKFKDDFRVMPIGRILRAIWLDELPMIWNLVKRDVKLVGVRPLSRHYLNLLSAEARERRRHYTPGLIPPYYADLPNTIEEFVASEQRYFDAYDQAPFRTDVRYLLLALRNILIHGVRSR